MVPPSASICLAPGRAGNAKASLCGFLQSEIASGPGIGVAEAEQQIAVGRPRADPVDGGERRVRVLGGKFAERRERQLAARDGAGDFLERADFRRRQSEPRQPRRTRPHDGRRRERIECGGEPRPDRVGARGRQLLRHDRGGKPGEAVRPPPQRRPPGCRHEREEA